MKKLLTGNEALARGAWEAGVLFASAYPGTPSTEILQNLAGFDEIDAEWAPNEKVALEAAIGASMAGARSIASMKHVGVNVAADPLFSFSYTGVHGGMVLVTADEPGQHSSQTEQDNRWYAKMAKIPMLEPADSNECRAMVMLAFEISEQFDTPVLLRITTRVCHSKSIVDCGERKDVPVKPYKKQIDKFITVPAYAKKNRVKIEERMYKLLAYSEATRLNRIEKGAGKTGVITAGACYHYAKEVFGDSVSYLKLGFTWPLPAKMIREFCEPLDTVYIIEENDPYIEETVMMQGFADKIKGKSVFPPYGELLPDTLRRCVYGNGSEVIEYNRDKVVPRPPILCAGCPHRGFFYELGRRKNIAITGDIGCYSLAFAEPYSALDTNLCMGAGFSNAHGAAKVFKKTGSNMRVVGVMGDSTFYHTGINSLLEVAYNGSNAVCVILDNAITGMTGHQNNPGNGLNAKGEIACGVSAEEMVRACGIKHIRVIDPNNITEVKEALDWALELDEASVIITRWPCVLKRLSADEKTEFNNPFKAKCVVDWDLCVGCKACLRCGCPALSYDGGKNKCAINHAQCVGCSVCGQVCPVNAIAKEGN